MACHVNGINNVTNSISNYDCSLKLLDQRLFLASNFSPPQISHNFYLYIELAGFVKKESTIRIGGGAKLYIILFYQKKYIVDDKTHSLQICPNIKKLKDFLNIRTKGLLYSQAQSVELFCTLKRNIILDYLSFICQLFNIYLKFIILDYLTFIRFIFYDPY